MRIVQITRLSWDILVICPKTDTQQQKTNVCLFVSCIGDVVAIQSDNVTTWTSMIILMTIGKGTRAESRFWIFSDLISNYISHDIHGKIYDYNRYFGILIISVTRKQFASRRS